MYEVNSNQSTNVTTPLPQREGLEEGLLTGIPVLDNDSVAAAVASTKTKTYIVPGVKKAKASLSDDQELDEIVAALGAHGMLARLTDYERERMAAGDGEA